MTILVDTSVLARLCNSSDGALSVAQHAVVALHRAGEELRLSSQNLIEFRCVATRPVAVNGLGLSSTDADARIAEFEALFPVLPDTERIFLSWKQIVSSLQVIGKQVHDARLAAFCHVHHISQLLTFNATHFTRMATTVPGLSVLHPDEV